FLAYPAGFRSGVFVAAGNVIDDAVSPGIEIVVGPNAGRQKVKVFDRDGVERASFFAYGPNFGGGVRVAVGNVNGMGLAEIVTAPGTGAARVKMFNHAGVEVLPSFVDVAAAGGLFVAAGDANRDGIAEIFTGDGAGANARIYSSAGELLRTINSPYGAGFLGGVRVAAVDFTTNGTFDLVTGRGRSGAPRLKVFDGLTALEVGGLFPYQGTFTKGFFVAAGL